MIRTISLAMIVRDEEENLAECLSSIRDEVDEIIIVDTGSKDQTEVIGRSFTDKIYSYQWQGDFSAARNFAISKCTGQWILCLDADEKLDCLQGSFRQLINNNPGAEVFGLPLRTSSDTKFEQFIVIRLFRNTADYYFVGTIHEQVLISNSNVVVIGETPVIWHKTISRKQRNPKRYRNLQLLTQHLKNNPDNYYLKYYMGVELLGLGQYEKALPYFREAVSNISPHQLMFRGPAIRYLVDCLKFLGHLDDALEVCQKESKLQPDYTDVFFDAGTILEEKGDFKRAIDYFNKAIQLGDPPLCFYHSKGTESFLAFYHVGFCYEKIGRHELAEDYYWQALKTNPNYVCPLYSLVLLKASNLKPSALFDYFRQKNSFVHDQWVETLGMLFLEVGLPSLAAECYKQVLALNGNNNINHIKSLLYSGCVKQGLELMSSMEPTGFSIDVLIEEIIAYLLSGNYCKAKQQVLALWKNWPQQRSKAWALLMIIARMSSSSGGYIGVEKTREPVVIQTHLAILENCLRFTTQDCSERWEESAASKMAQTTSDILIDLSAESNKCLIDYIQGKAEATRYMLDYKYRAARGLFL